MFLYVKHHSKMCLYVHMVYPSPTKETRFVNVQSPKHLFSWFDLLVKLLPTKSRMESWMEPCKNKKQKHELPNQLTHFLVLDQIQRHMSYKDGTLDNNLIISILQ